MAQIYANWEAITPLTGQTFATGKETGIVTATSVHQIFCLASGSITVTPMIGPSFTWAATAGSSLDCVVKSASAVTGTNFVAFRSKAVFPQGRGSSGGWQY